ncbi:MAG: YihY/virulence factor BrkB family protein [Acidobacteria bacterium]|nr:YihY/virulence factor BrkB family protein [Acidobacteriota bacterium]
MSPEPQFAAAAAPAPVISTPSPGPLERGWLQLKSNARGLGAYLARTEVHTYAFSVAANAILSFFPFVLVMLTLTRSIFHSRAMYEALLALVQDHLPSNQDFVIRNLRALSSHQGVRVFSLVMLLITSTGVFLPLEVALNRIWGFAKNRSYLWNQVVSLALTLGCGAFAMLSVAATAGNQRAVEAVLLGHSDNFVFRGATYVLMKLVALAASIVIFFLIYWILPHGRVPVRAVAPAAFATGIVWEAAKYAYVLALPWLNFQDVYGPFAVSVTLIMWAFFSGMLLLGGAYLSASGAAGAALRQSAAQA